MLCFTIKNGLKGHLYPLKAIGEAKPKRTARQPVPYAFLALTMFFHMHMDHSILGFVTKSG